MTASTRTGGRQATTATIPGRYALSVGNPGSRTPEGFSWTLLSTIARLESGHTPSRSHPEYWDDGIPWVGIKDATENHGSLIMDTKQHVSDLGIQHSSARLLPAGTVCLSRTASVGYVVVMGRSMATSQDFVNWVCGPELSNRYFAYMLLSEQEFVRSVAFGTTHKTLYYPDAKALHVMIPVREIQDRVVSLLGALDDKIVANRALSESAGELTRTVCSNPSERMVELAHIASLARSSVKPELMEEVAHFSLPAFDDGGLPEIARGESILSSKQLLGRPCVLLSKLNPRIPRVWDVPALPEYPSLASTEFLVLEGKGIPTGFLWGVLMQSEVQRELQGLARGTTGSHQRVNPDDAMSLLVPDPASLGCEVLDLVDALSKRSWQAKLESSTIGQLRDTLLPALMSGRLSVRDAEAAVSKVV